MLGTVEHLGKYVLFERIGAGGMAEVFLARTTVAQGLQKTLVVKKILPNYAKSKQFVAMFVEEAKIALSLNHPNIVQVFDFGAAADTFFLAMERVEGQDLLRLLQNAAQKRQRTPQALAAYIVQQIAKGLDYAHRKCDEYGDPLQIVHRDISPQNVLLSWDGDVKIVDFGIAKARDTNEEPGVIKGKFAYMSPEQARGQAVDARSDVFAAGIVLYEMVCARPLFTGKGKEALEQVRAGAIPAPRTSAPDLHPMLEAIMLRALAFSPEQRYPSARELQQDLGRYLVEWAAQSGEAMDSTTLAQWISEVTPPEVRQALRARPKTGGDALDNDPPIRASQKNIDLSTAAPPAAQAAQVQQRPVYVVEFAPRSIADETSSLAVPTELQRDFAKLAAEVLFKHDAMLVPSESKQSALAVVGFPTSSERDATRAIRLGHALIETLDAITEGRDFRLGVSIQRGHVTIDPAKKGAPDLTAQTRRFSHELARITRGGDVLIGGHVFRAARGEWHVDAVGSIEVPDEATTQNESTEPGLRRAKVYRVKQAKSRSERREAATSASGIVGRELEQKALRDAYRDVLIGGTRRAVMLLGETGIGKRSVVSAFVASIPPGEAIIVRTTLRSDMGAVPFSAIADLARDLLGLPDDATPVDIQQRVERMLPLIYPDAATADDAKAAAAAAARLFGSTESSEAADLQPLLLSLMAHIERRFSPRTPLVLIGEDIHWGDQQSWDLFLTLFEAQLSRPVLGIMTARADERVLRGAQRIAANQLVMEELSLRDQQEFLAARFVPGTDIAALAKVIDSRTGGHPLFMTELVDALTGQGVFVPSETDEFGRLTWERPNIGDVLPSSLADLLVARLAELPEATLDVLLAGAVLGATFSPHTLRELVGRQLQEDVDRLCRYGMWQERRGELRFRNELARGVAYGQLPVERRKQLHLAAARQLQALPTYHALSHDAIIAYHLESAGEFARAAQFWASAADASQKLGANVESLQQLDHALRTTPATDQRNRFELYRTRAEVLRRLGKRPAQLRELSLAKRAADATGDALLIGTVHVLIGRLHLDVGQPHFAVRAATAAESYFAQQHDLLHGAGVVSLQAQIASVLGEPGRAIDLCERALATCHQLLAEAPNEVQRNRPIYNQLAELQTSRGHAFFAMGHLEAALDCFAEPLVIYRTLGMARLESVALANLASTFAALAEFEEALHHYRTAITIDQQHGDRAGMAARLAGLGHCFLELGDYNAATNALEKAIALSPDVDAPPADVLCTFAQVKIAQGKWHDAERLLGQALARAKASNDVYQQVRAMLFEALVQLETGLGPMLAQTTAEAATELARTANMEAGVVHGLMFAALAQSQTPATSQALARAKEALARFAALPRPAAADQMWRWFATVAKRAGQTEIANEASDRASREVNKRASRLRDARLRATYLAVRGKAS